MKRCTALTAPALLTEGPNAGKWDNSPVMAEILALRHELAQLLGFESYAFKSLATKMAENPAQVLEFLTDLAKRARPQGGKRAGATARVRQSGIRRR